MSFVRAAAIGVTALVVGAADIPEDVRSWQPWTTLVAVVAALALATLRFTGPYGSLVTLGCLAALGAGAQLSDEPGQVPFGIFLVVALLIADVASSARTSILVTMALLAAAAAVATEGLADDRGASDVVFVAMLWASTGSIAVARRWRRQARDARDEHVRMLERQRIARDLHDTVAHHVSAIALTAEGARGFVDTDSSIVDRSLGSIHSTAAAALDEMRRTVSILRDDTGAPPLGLDGLSTAIDTAGPLDVSFAVTEDLDQVSVEIADAIHRVVQEAVTNARRHAVDATVVSVDVRATQDRVLVVVTDDGCASSGTESSGFGLAGMRERVELLGGSLHAGPQTDGGWSIEADLPRSMPR